MDLTIHLSPEEKVRLTVAAAREGLDPAALAHRLVSRHLPPVPSDEEDPTLALLAEWDREDAKMTPEEIEEARRDFEAFKQNLNTERARAGARLVYP